MEHKKSLILQQDPNTPPPFFEVISYFFPLLTFSTWLWTLLGVSRLIPEPTQPIGADPTVPPLAPTDVLELHCLLNMVDYRM